MRTREYKSRCNPTFTSHYSPFLKGFCEGLKKQAKDINKLSSIAKTLATFLCDSFELLPSKDIYALGTLSAKLILQSNQKILQLSGDRLEHELLHFVLTSPKFCHDINKYLHKRAALDPDCLIWMTDDYEDPSYRYNSPGAGPGAGPGLGLGGLN